MLSFVSCSKRITLEDYANNLFEASYPDSIVTAFVDTTSNYPPDKRLSIFYNFLLTNWTYLEDDNENDFVNNASNIISENKFVGDCDDFCSVLMACCRSINLTANFCLGESIENKNKGHVWVEVIICSINSFDKDLENRLYNIFSKNSNYENIYIYNRDSLVFLSLNPFEMTKNYKLTHIVNNEGKLIKIKD